MIVNFEKSMMKLQRSEKENNAIQVVSEYISGLDLDTEENDGLCRVLVDMVNVIEKEQFMSGVQFGLRLSKEGEAT